MSGLIGYRKFLLVLLVLLSANVMLAVGRIDGPAFVDLVVWAVGLYMGGNVGSTAAKRINTGMAAPPEG